MWPRAEGLRAFSFGDAEALRRRLTALALNGTKVATAGLLEQDYREEGEPVETVGEHQALLGDDDEVAALIEITRVETYQFCKVPWEFADAEGEGFTSIEHWRDGHRSYYRRQAIELEDTTRFVCVWFRLVDIRTIGRDGSPMEAPRPEAQSAGPSTRAFGPRLG